MKVVEGNRQLKSRAARIGAFLFKRRSLIGAFFFIFAVIFARPTVTHLLIGILTTFVGELIRWSSVAYSGPTTRARTFVAPRLVTEGPYSIVRNPIYWGNFFVGFGFLWASGALFPYLILIYIGAFWIYYRLIISAEEDFLKEKFTYEFTEYAKKTGRFLPSFKAKWKKGNAQFKEAIRSERSTIYLIISWFVLMVVIWSFK